VTRRGDLERHLTRLGCTKLREGGRHSIWVGPSGARASVPRHREIPRTTAHDLPPARDRRDLTQT
jgi:predicted RNA binding protein YcfA (HicA-like mRNA interferase family)